MKKLILLLTVAAALSSCNNSEEQVPTDVSGRIDLRAGIEAFTRSPHLEADGSGTFGDSDVFTLTASAGGSSVKMIDYAMPSTNLYWEDLKLPGGTKEVSFTGCYPRHDSSMGSSFIFNINRAEGEEKDLLLAPAVKVQAGSASPVRILFRHAMHKLVVKYQSDNYTDEELKTIQTTPYGAADCTVDLVSGSVSAVTTGAPESYGAQTGKEMSVLLVPQAKNLVSLHGSFKGRPYVYELSKLPETTDNGQSTAILEGGKQLVVEFNLSKDGITVSGVNIQGWESQGNVSDDIAIGE